jgi:hypothetical protein
MDNPIKVMLAVGTAVSFINQVNLGAEIAWLPAYATKLMDLVQMNPDLAWHMTCLRIQLYLQQMLMQVCTVSVLAVVAWSQLTKTDE